MITTHYTEVDALVRGHAFGSYVRQHREAKGVSLRKFAHQVGMSPTYLSKVERTEFPPPGETKIVAIAAVLDLDPDELLARAGRIRSDLQPIIIQHPRPMAVLVRHAAELSTQELGMLLSFLDRLKGKKKVQDRSGKVQRRKTKGRPTLERKPGGVNNEVEPTDFERAIAFED